MRGVPIGSPSRSGYALRLGARIRPTALRSFLLKPESETSLSSVMTSAGGDTKDTYCGYTSFVTSAGGDTKDPYCGYTSFVTSAGGQTNHSPQSEGVARTTGGDKTSSIDRPLVGRTRNSLLANDLEGGDSFTATHSDDIAATW